MSNQQTSEVSSFYKGKSVFLTGGTGFLGKTLIEKLLYSCTEINKIYVLVRGKRGNGAHDRITNVTDSPAFDRLKAIRSKDLNKIIPVVGDITQTGIGLSADIVEVLQNEVSIVFHLAAAVNFDAPLKSALSINVNGTNEVIQLCRRIHKLQAFVYVSTAFTNSDRCEIKEEIYPMSVSLLDAVNAAKLHDNNIEVTHELIGKKPNTYTFSKALAEVLVEKECSDIPTAIVRPSIVMPALKEPCPGWIDSWSGLTTVVVGTNVGNLKVVNGRGSIIADIVPVDIVTNLIIAVATKCTISPKIEVYNCCTGTSNPITYGRTAAIIRRVTLKYGLNDIPWAILLFTPNTLLYSILNMALQIIPAFIMDFVLLITGKKPTQLKLQRKLRKVMDAVKYFYLNEWQFTDDNVKKLYKTLSVEDRNIFYFDMKMINWEKCIENGILGCRKYLLGKDDNKKVEAFYTSEDYAKVFF